MTLAINDQAVELMKKLRATSLLAILLSAGSASALPSSYNDGWGFDVSGMNTAVKPGNDFFGYANGRYIQSLKIPSDLASFGPFHILFEQSLTRQKNILDSLKIPAHKKEALDLSDNDKLAIFYADFMDHETVNRLGIKPLESELSIIQSLNTDSDIAKYMGSNIGSFHYSPIAVDIEQSQKDPGRYMLLLDQGMSIGVTGGLGLPDQSYYLEKPFEKVRKAYQAYIQKILGIAGYKNSATLAQKIVAVETRIAQVQTPRADTRDPIKTFNPMKIKRLQKDAPDFDWKAFLQGAGLTDHQIKKELINVREPEAIGRMASVIKNTDHDTIKAWLVFHLVDNAAGYLSDPISKTSFNFNAGVLAGVKTQSPRWKRGINAVNQAMGWALGRAYVKRYFPASAKKEIVALTDDLKKAFAERLKTNTWMDERTREAAQYKLSKFAIQVGYPIKWRNYSSLEIKAGDLFGNANRAQAFNWNYRLQRLDLPVDRDEWEMTPQTINAYNNPTMNEVVFPAAILQPPFFDPKGDKAVNLGGIGGVIGHELSHGFDDQGRHYSAEGKLADWWTPQSAQKFSILADKLADQYSHVQIQPGLYVNGKMTLGEDIADLGGLNLALEAYDIFLKEHHIAEPDKKHGFTGKQRVFLGWAQVWRQKDRPDALKKLVLSNEHAPSIARVNTPVRNIDSWYESFDIKKGTKLYLEPKDRVKMW